MQAITMPKWGLAMEEGTVVAWQAAEGSEVAAGEEILEIETTKITNVFESPAAGILRRCLVQEGETVPVGALLAVVAGSDVPDAEIDAYVADFQANFAVAAEEAAEAVPQPETLIAAGRQINYLAMGPDEGLPLVLLHGFGGDLNNWLFNQPALAESRRVYALDLPGHGRSAKDLGGGGMAVLAETLAGFLDALAIKKAHLAGHSMGGALGLVFALNAPERVASLTMVAPGGLGAEINMDFIGGFIAAGRRKEMKSVLQLLVADPDLISRDMIEDVLKYKRLDGVDAALKGLAEALFSGGQQEAIPAAQLAKLAVPAQAIWGKADRVLPARHAEALPDKVALHLLEDVGHMPHMEAAAEVNRLIAALAD